jgi:hypothetical protein
LGTVVAAPNREAPVPSTPPLQVYAERRQQRQLQAGRQARQEQLAGNAKVVVFLGGIGLGYLALGAQVLSAWWLSVPAVAFAVLLVWHERLTRALHGARRAVAFYEAGLARLEGHWQGRGQPGTRFRDENHPYAADLDLFGTGSLFELLCTARTRTGEDTLAGWLRGPAAPAVVRARQAAVAELRPQLDLREDLALLGGDVPAGVDFEAVAGWGAAPPVLQPRWPRWPLLALGVLSIITLVGWLVALFGFAAPESWLGAFFLQWRSIPFGIVVLAQVVLFVRLRARVAQVLGSVERRNRDLAMLARVLARLEEATFTAPLLRQLHTQLDSEGGRTAPSQQIARLGNLLDLLESRRNQLFAPVAFLLMWGTQMAYAIESWRSCSGPAIGRWLAALGEFEALGALAAYSFENPSDPFPEVVEAGPCYEGEALAHPLLPRGRCVANDLQLGEPVRLLVVSGSNMSGKSTFLRTVGVNAVLALAGAPVCARRVRLSPLAVGATLRIQDSLQEGRSRFYAEVLRVRQVVDLSRGPIPLLFLLDELFAGTNSHDRRLGAEAVLGGLVEAGAIGLVTTHDLALTQIVDRQGPGVAANVHFADHFEDGVMRFDYRLQPGVVRHSNALALMRAVGLRV